MSGQLSHRFASHIVRHRTAACMLLPAGMMQPRLRARDPYLAADTCNIPVRTCTNLHTAHSYRVEAARTSKAIWSLEREREKYSSEAAEAAAKYQQVRAFELTLREASCAPPHTHTRASSCILRPLRR